MGDFGEVLEAVVEGVTSTSQLSVTIADINRVLDRLYGSRQSINECVVSFSSGCLFVTAAD